MTKEDELVDHTVPPPAEEPPEEPTEATEVERLQAELEEARAQAADYLDGWQRAQADFANYRRRQETERQQLTQLSNAILIAKFLPVIDDMQRALATLPDGIQLLSWVDGIYIIKRKLEAMLESEGVEPIETTGRGFDPRYHEAVTYEETAGCADGEIIGEIQRGYTLGERVIRPALVRVARGMTPPAPTPEETEPLEGESASDRVERVPGIRE